MIRSMSAALRVSLSTALQAWQTPAGSHRVDQNRISAIDADCNDGAANSPDFGPRQWEFMNWSTFSSALLAVSFLRAGQKRLGEFLRVGGGYGGRREKLTVLLLVLCARDTLS